MTTGWMICGRNREVKPGQGEAGRRMEWTPEAKVFRSAAAAADRAPDSPCPGHETTNQLSDAFTTTSIRQPPPTPPARGKLDTNAPMLECPNTKHAARNILCQPAVHRLPPCARPASKRPSATRKTTIPNRPNLSEPRLNHQLASPGSPKTRSANLGFEIRGFSRPRNHESSARPSTPGLPPSPNSHPKPPKSNCQTDPISLNPSKSASYGHLPLAESRISPGPRQSKITVARSSKRPAAFPGLPSD